MKDHEELGNQTNELFKFKARKECLWERFTNSFILGQGMQDLVLVTKSNPSLDRS